MIYGEETIPISFGQGVFTADLPSAIPDGYCAETRNLIPVGTSVESRFGFKKSSVDFDEAVGASNLLTSFTYFGATGDSDAPIMIWGSDFGGVNQYIHFLREGSQFSNPGGGLVADGYFNATISDDFVGAVNYNGTYYLFLSSGVHKITSLNWAVPSYAMSSVVGSPGSSIAPIHFFDRLWTAQGNKLYWTDAISSPGALPETWSTSANFVSIVGENGPGKIYKILPLNSRIFIFTSQGLFALTVVGQPTQWYLRPIDDKAIVNTPDCAFEIGGLIYFISIYGVFVTDGTSNAIKLSGPIENFFLAGNFERGVTSPSKRSNLYRINYHDGGLIISISNVFVDGIGNPYYDIDFCRTFYTRLANIAWSEWQVDSPNQLIAVVAIADSVESYINKSPLSYLMMYFGESDAASPANARRELMVYDGLRDEWVDDDGVDQTANIQMQIKTKFFDSGSPVDYKKFNYAFLNFYISVIDNLNDNTYWSYKWVTDSDSYDESSSFVPNIEDTIVSGNEFNMVKLASGFNFRLAQLELNFNTNNDTNFKIRELVLKQDTLRDGPSTAQ